MSFTLRAFVAAMVALKKTTTFLARTLQVKRPLPAIPAD
jgi:hypothetical protein